MYRQTFLKNSIYNNTSAQQLFIVRLLVRQITVVLFVQLWCSKEPNEGSVWWVVASSQLQKWNGSERLNRNTQPFVRLFTVCRRKRSEQRTTDTARCWPKVFSGCWGSGRRESLLPLTAWGDRRGAWSSQIHPVVNPAAQTLPVDGQIQYKQVKWFNYCCVSMLVHEVHGLGFPHGKPLTSRWRVSRSLSKIQPQGGAPSVLLAQVPQYPS